MGKSVAVSDSTYNRLRARGKYGVTMDSIVNAVLDLAESYEKIVKVEEADIKSINDDLSKGVTSGQGS